jgi:hypothetical protein
VRFSLAAGYWDVFQVRQDRCWMLILVPGKALCSQPSAGKRPRQQRTPSDIAVIDETRFA